MPLQPTTPDGVLDWMQVERAPILGAGLAVVMLCIETLALFALASQLV